MEQSQFIATVAAVLIALIEVFKRTGLPDRFAPITAVVLGAFAAFVAASQHALASPDPFTTALTGLIVGLTAAGAYSGVRATIDSRPAP